MTKGQVIFGVGSVLLIGTVYYYGFYKKYANGLTWYEGLTTPAVGGLVKGYAKNKGEWIGQVTGNYNDDYYVAKNSAGAVIYLKKSDVTVNSTNKAVAKVDTNVYTLK